MVNAAVVEMCVTHRFERRQLIVPTHNHGNHSSHPAAAVKYSVNIQIQSIINRRKVLVKAIGI